MRPHWSLHDRSINGRPRTRARTDGPRPRLPPRPAGRTGPPPPQPGRDRPRSRSGPRARTASTIRPASPIRRHSRRAHTPEEAPGFSRLSGYAVGGCKSFRTKCIRGRSARRTNARNHQFTTLSQSPTEGPPNEEPSDRSARRRAVPVLHRLPVRNPRSSRTAHSLRSETCPVENSTCSHTHS